MFLLGNLLGRHDQLLRNELVNAVERVALEEVAGKSWKVSRAVLLGWLTGGSVAAGTILKGSKEARRLWGFGNNAKARRLSVACTIPLVCVWFHDYFERIQGTTVPPTAFDDVCKSIFHLYSEPFPQRNLAACSTINAQYRLEKEDEEEQPEVKPTRWYTLVYLMALEACGFAQEVRWRSIETVTMVGFLTSLKSQGLLSRLSSPVDQYVTVVAINAGIQGAIYFICNELDVELPSNIASTEAALGYLARVVEGPNRRKSRSRNMRSQH